MSTSTWDRALSGRHAKPPEEWLRFMAWYGWRWTGDGYEYRRGDDMSPFVGYGLGQSPKHARPESPWWRRWRS